MEWYEALLLGIIQGLTEFLPVSSSGHLEISSYLLNTDTSQNLFFTRDGFWWILDRVLGGFRRGRDSSKIPVISESSWVINRHSVIAVDNFRDIPEKSQFCNSDEPLKIEMA